MSGRRSRVALVLGAVLMSGVGVPFAYAQQERAKEQQESKRELLPPPDPASLSPMAAPTSAPPRDYERIASDGGAAAPVAHAAERAPSTPSGTDYRTTFKGAAGFQYAQVHGVPVTGGRLRLGVGAQSDARAFYAMATMLYGSTEEGRRTWDVRGSLSVDLLRLGILRLGGDLAMGYLVIRRATVDSRMWALGLGAGVHASIDAYRFGPRNDHAIFVEGRFDAHLHFGTAFMWGPTILAGLRY